MLKKKNKQQSEDLGTFDQINQFPQFWISDTLYKVELALLWNVLKANVIYIVRMLDYKGMMLITDHSTTVQEKKRKRSNDKEKHVPQFKNRTPLLTAGWH